MGINILAFGVAREIIGAPAINMQPGQGQTAGNIKATLEEQYPRLQQLSSFMIAVNGAYAGPDTVIKPGDEVAIIPPVSGG